MGGIWPAPTAVHSRLRIPKAALAALVPFAALVEFPVGGRLYLIEILLLMYLMMIGSRRRDLLSSREVRIALLLLGAWLAGQILTDIFRATPPGDLARGWAKIGMTATNFMALWVLLRVDPQRVRWFIYGLAAASVVGTLANPVGHAVGDPWKFGIAVPLTLSLAASVRSRLGATGVMAALAIVNLLLGFRSLGGILLMAVILHIVEPLFSSAASGRSSTRRFIVAGIILAVGLGAITTYTFAASSGALGPDEREKVAWQSRGNLGVLLGGRLEILASSQAVQDSPILGHGSWAKDAKYRDLLTQRAADYGYLVLSADDADEAIPSHSHLLGTWVEAGVMGIFVWIVVFGLGFREVLALDRYRPLWPLSLVVGLLLMWDVLFSPFGADRRYLTPVLVIVLLTAQRRRLDGHEAGQGK